MRDFSPSSMEQIHTKMVAHTSVWVSEVKGAKNEKNLFYFRRAQPPAGR